MLRFAFLLFHKCCVASGKLQVAYRMCIHFSKERRINKGGMDLFDPPYLVRTPQGSVELLIRHP